MKLVSASGAEILIFFSFPLSNLVLSPSSTLWFCIQVKQLLWEQAEIYCHFSGNPFSLFSLYPYSQSCSTINSFQKQQLKKKIHFPFPLTIFFILKSSIFLFLPVPKVQIRVWLLGLLLGICHLITHIKCRLEIILWGKELSKIWKWMEKRLKMLHCTSLVQCLYYRRVTLNYVGDFLHTSHYWWYYLPKWFRNLI